MMIIMVIILWQIETRDGEIDRLSRQLEGGRPYDVVALETRNRSNERLISHLNIQVSISTSTSWRACTTSSFYKTVWSNYRKPEIVSQTWTSLNIFFLKYLKSNKPSCSSNPDWLS